MPQKRNSPPPEVMTWPKASPALIMAGISDALRYFFIFFAFSGPALATVVCTAVVNGHLQTWTAGWLGLKTAAAVCGTGASVVGFFSAPALAAIGAVMAIAVGFAGWLAVTVYILKTDGRVLGENPIAAIWLLEGIGASVLVMAGGVYRAQIKKEQTALKKYEQEQAARQMEDRNQKIAELMQVRASQSEQAEKQDAAETEEYNEMIDNEEIPDGVREAA